VSTSVADMVREGIACAAVHQRWWCRIRPQGPWCTWRALYT